MSQDLGDFKNLMPTERKSVWRTAEERRMSDLTRVLEWLERRQGKKKRALQKKIEEANRAEEKAGKKGPGAKKKLDKDGRKVTFNKNQDPNAIKKLPVGYQRGYITDVKGKRLNMMSTAFSRDGLKKSDLDIKDVIALENNTRISPYRRQSSVDPVLQETMFGTRRVGLLRDWSNKAPDNTYDRKLKSLMEKGTEPKIESAKMLKPEEVLSCRYLRLSKNNIKTLIKLCKDAGMDVEIHPHMVEAEIDAKKIFDHLDVPRTSSFDRCCDCKGAEENVSRGHTCHWQKRSVRGSEEGSGGRKILSGSGNIPWMATKDKAVHRRAGGSKGHRIIQAPEEDHASRLKANFPNAEGMDQKGCDAREKRCQVPEERGVHEPPPRDMVTCFDKRARYFKRRPASVSKVSNSYRGGSFEYLEGKAECYRIIEAATLGTAYLTEPQ
ncbi:uncharacterized protein C16orf78 homolog [Onychomys torridus]|uniref:uncharacterized protein C16orf78 homolog n=1 Tax=Onychomys torridus TaxID=38674 RepID=UPI00167F73BD|nr:uncharacterized protein C16orf78 homolog [Onychomys torridus]